MKFIPYNNQPNVSENRFESFSPSMALDSRGYPHISWLTRRNGYNDVNYKYWDGFNWKYHDVPNFAKSKEEIVYAPNSIALNSYDNPYIVYVRKDSIGQDILVVSLFYNGSWTTKELVLDYEVEWGGIHYVQENPTSDESESSIPVYEISSSSETSASSGDSSTSSSSSSSTSSISSNSIHAEDIIAILVYGDDGILRIYDLNTIIELISSISVVITDFESIKTIPIGRMIGIAYLEDKTQARYNFFDCDTYSWNYGEFQVLSSSVTTNEISDMSICGHYSNNKISKILFSFVINETNANWLLYCSVESSFNNGDFPLSEFTETVEKISYTSEMPNVPEDYIFDGYKISGIYCDNNGNPRIMACGISTILFEKVNGSWNKYNIDMAAGNGIAYESISVKYDYYNGLIKVAFANDGKTIYYFEQSLLTDGMDQVYPNMLLLNKERLYITDWQDTSFSGGKQVDCVYGTKYGDLIKNPSGTIGIFHSEEDPCCESSSSSTDICPNNIRFLDGSIVANGAGFTFDKYINVNINGSTNKGYSLPIYSGDVSGKTASNKTFYGQLYDTALTTNGYISTSANGNTFYIPKYTSSAGSNCCSNVIGDATLESVSTTYTLYGYGLANINNSELRYLPLYDADSLLRRWVADWEYSCASNTWSSTCTIEQFLKKSDPHSDDLWVAINNCSSIHYGHSYPINNFPSTCDIADIAPSYSIIYPDVLNIAISAHAWEWYYRSNNGACYYGSSNQWNFPMKAYKIHPTLPLYYGEYGRSPSQWTHECSWFQVDINNQDYTQTTCINYPGELSHGQCALLLPPNTITLPLNEDGSYALPYSTTLNVWAPFLKRYVPTDITISDGGSSGIKYTGVDCCMARWVATWSNGCATNTSSLISCNSELCQENDIHGDDTWDSSDPAIIVHYGKKYLPQDLPVACDISDDEPCAIVDLFPVFGGIYHESPVPPVIRVPQTNAFVNPFSRTADLCAGDGCIVDDWFCIDGTQYISEGVCNGVTDSVAAEYGYNVHPIPSGTLLASNVAIGDSVILSVVDEFGSYYGADGYVYWLKK